MVYLIILSAHVSRPDKEPRHHRQYLASLLEQLSGVNWTRGARHVECAEHRVGFLRHHGECRGALYRNCAPLPNRRASLALFEAQLESRELNASVFTSAFPARSAAEGSRPS